MINVSEKYYGISLKNWILIILLFLYFFYFYNNDLFFNSESNNKPLDKFTNVNTPITVYNFDTDWCGYSVRFQPEWKKFENLVKNDTNLAHVTTKNIKCDNSQLMDMCNDYNVPGFPTIIIEYNNNRQQYEGPRSAIKLIETLRQI
jgi:hypothetical protein